MTSRSKVPEVPPPAPAAQQAGEAWATWLHDNNIVREDPRRLDVAKKLADEECCVPSIHGISDVYLRELGFTIGDIARFNTWKLANPYQSPADRDGDAAQKLLSLGSSAAAADSSKTAEKKSKRGRTRGSKNRLTSAAQGYTPESGKLYDTPYNTFEEAWEAIQKESLINLNLCYLNKHTMKPEHYKLLRCCYSEKRDYQRYAKSTQDKVPDGQFGGCGYAIKISRAINGRWIINPSTLPHMNHPTPQQIYEKFTNRSGLPRELRTVVTHCLPSSDNQVNYKERFSIYLAEAHKTGKTITSGIGDQKIKIPNWDAIPEAVHQSILNQWDYLASKKRRQLTNAAKSTVAAAAASAMPPPPKAAPASPTDEADDAATEAPPPPSGEPPVIKAADNTPGAETIASFTPGTAPQRANKRKLPPAASNSSMDAKAPAAKKKAMKATAPPASKAVPPQQQKKNLTSKK